MLLSWLFSFGQFVSNLRKYVMPRIGYNILGVLWPMQNRKKKKRNLITLLLLIQTNIFFLTFIASFSSLSLYNKLGSHLACDSPRNPHLLYILLHSMVFSPHSIVIPLIFFSYSNVGLHIFLLEICLADFYSFL